MKKTMLHLHNMKQRGQRIVMLTCYDYQTAVLQEQAGVDVIFVGDSVGTNVLGYESERDVSLDEIMYHLRMVRRGVKDAYLLADMPHQTYENSAAALHTARQLLACGADGVKLEGMQAAIVQTLCENGIDVWTHLGYNPQLHPHVAMQGKTVEQAIALVEDALALQQAGASMLVLELVPEQLAAAITERLTIPTIGIAAGRYTDGQVQIVNDLLGANPRTLRHVKPYMNYRTEALAAFRSYADEVRQQAFPDESHARPMKETELQRLQQWLEG